MLAGARPIVLAVCMPLKTLTVRLVPRVAYAHQVSIRRSSSVNLSKNRNGPEHRRISGMACKSTCVLVWRQLPPTRKIFLLQKTTSPEKALPSIRDNPGRTRGGCGTGRQGWPAFSQASGNAAGSGSMSPGSGRSWAPSGCRANRPDARSCTGAASGHGQPPNPVRW